MGKRITFYLVLTAVLFGVIGLVLGQFVRMPIFNASDGGGGNYPTIAGPLFAAVNPEDKSVKKSWLKVVTRDTNPYRNCPDGWAPNPTVTFPFYLKHEALEVVRDRIIATVPGPFTKKKHNLQLLNEYLYGYDWEYKVVMDEYSVTAKSSGMTEKIRKFPAYEYYAPSSSSTHWDKEIDLAGKLDEGNTIYQADVNLCYKPSQGGGGGAGE